MGTPTPFKTLDELRQGLDETLFTALYGMQTRSYDENSVCPSVCPAVKRVHSDKTEERYVYIFIPYERSFILVF